jgi:poly(hydroxyalkanoate) depolymerase family esterase
VAPIASVPATAAVAKVVPKPGQAQSFQYGSGKTAYPYLVYTPPSWKPGDHWPLLVMLHGCETTADQQMNANLYNPLANKKHFVVLYPDVDQVEANQPGPLKRCWHSIFSSADWDRGQGDQAAVIAMVRMVIKDWAVNRQRVYLMGMSAGSFLSADMAEAYPDVFAASGENAGGAYADSTCVFITEDSLPVATTAQLAYAQMGKRARVVPRIVIGGDADQGIPPACADKALLQGLRTDNLVIDGSQTAPIGLTPTSVRTAKVAHGRTYKVSSYRDPHGCLVGQRYLVHGMNHFWSGGSSNPKWKDFTDPKGPSAAVASWRFFSRYTLANTARIGHERVKSKCP